ncbi:ATP-dependent DNA ligase [Tokyovirus A1]|uniref:ATP-dependent DNA ligase n=1 Tax=Tokyovirus A1 TaxID=1826170 RepID=UPI0007A964CB|nr:ATP-dependent DNA ligase [Tokyovirus A1]BAU79995.1 ATP-dependent DNA ligase [Tokyovirus A1]
MLPVLYCETKTGKTMQWRVWSEGENIIKEFGYVGGKLRTVETKAKPKNVGRSNSTTSEEQAVKERDCSWIKQLDKGYAVDKDDEEAVAFASKILEAKEDAGGNNHNVMASSKKEEKNTAKKSQTKEIFLPMLAEKYNDIMNPKKKSRAKKFQFREGSVAQPKLDGVRCIARIVEGNVELLSRKGKQIVHLQHIREGIAELLKGRENMVLDGELYFHGEEMGENERFELITGAARSVRKEPHEREDRLEYWIFDIVDTEKTWLEREKELDSLLSGDLPECIVPVLTEPVHSHEEMLQLHEEWVERGFEGTILRDAELMYTPKKRSRLLLKYKDFEDAEYEIVGVSKSEGGTEDGAAIFVLETESGDTFTCRPTGTIEWRREMYKKKKGLIGKMVTVKFQGRNEETGVPRFPRAVAVRDYEG